MIILGIGVVCAVIFAVLAFASSMYSIIQIESFKKSTHQITYIDPTKQNFSEFNSETKAKLAKSDETLDTI